MSKQTRTVALTIIFTLLVVVALQNFRSVALNIIVWRPAVPLFVLVGLAFAAGWIGCWYWRRR